MGDLTSAKWRMANDVSRDGILAACETLHMLHTGAMDGDDNELRWEICRLFIEKRLANWVANPSDFGPTAGEYDAAVKAVMEASLKLESAWARSAKEDWGKPAVVG